MKTTLFPRLPALALGLIAATGASALNTPFASLPASTIVALRMDQRPEAMQPYLEGTRLGATLFSEERIAEYKALLEQYLEEEEVGQKIAADLERYGLEPEDLYAVFSSHLGAAVIRHPVGGLAPMPTLVAWADLPAGSAEKMLSAVYKAVEEGEGTTERMDEEVAGTTVSRLRDLEDDSSFLLARLEDRLLFLVGSPPVGSIDSEADSLAYEEGEIEALGYFIQAQKGDGGAFLETLYEDPAIRVQRPSFPVRLELLGDVQALLELIPAEQAALIDQLGLRAFTRFGFWNGLEDGIERQSGIVGLPAPRSGIGRMFEVDAFSFSPPEWIPANVSAYSEAAVDLPRLYEVGLEVARKILPPEVVDQRIAMANQQLQGMLQIDLEGLIGSFGNRLHVLEYPMETQQVTLGAETIELPVAAQAFAIDFDRPDIIQMALQMAGAFTANPESPVSKIEEQGFSGLRFKSPEGDVVVAHGLGRLVFTKGNQLHTRIFSALNSPPEGEAALRTSPKFRAFIDEVAPAPGVAFNYTDGASVLGDLREVLGFAQQTLARQNPKLAEQSKYLDLFLEILPAEEEMAELIGSIHARMDVRDEGLTVESATDLR